MKRPSTEWGLSPVEQHWIIVRFVEVLSDCLQQFGIYNVYKDDSNGLDLRSWTRQWCFVAQILLSRHTFILRAVYSYCNEMKFWVISNPLPAVGGVYSMYAVNLNPNYPALKYTKGFIEIRVANIHN